MHAFEYVVSSMSFVRRHSARSVALFLWVFYQSLTFDWNNSNVITEYSTAEYVILESLLRLFERNFFKEFFLLDFNDRKLKFMQKTHR